MQVQYTEKDLESLKKEHKNCIQRLQNLKAEGEKTKASEVKRLIEINLPLIESGKISGYTAKEELAVYLWKELVKYELAEPFIDYSWFIRQFPDNLKRKYSESGYSDFLKAGMLKGGEVIEKSMDQKTIKIGNKIYKQVDEQRGEQIIERVKKAEQEKEKKTKQSVVLECLYLTREFLTAFDGFVDRFEKKLGEEPQILKDFEKSATWNNLYDMCLALKEIYDPKGAKKYSDRSDPDDEGLPSIMNQMNDEINFRAPATIFQKAMCKSLQVLTSARQWAHMMAVSPRQHQRIRQRLAEWPLKKAQIVIHNVLGSHICPCGCRFNLISKRKVPKNPTELVLGDAKIDVPKKYRNLGANPIEICAELFAGKIKIKSR